MNTMDVVNEYRKVAAEFASKYDVDSPHIISIISSVMMTRDGVGLRGGGFVQAVVNNDLYRAVSSADVECYNNLKVIVASNQFAHVNIAFA
jgi:acid phosphatase family membrane protein YuiD